jgi:sugar phosphate isomerase/epimerase
LDLQSAFGMPPVEYVTLAADLGCGHVTTGAGPTPWNPCGYPRWSLRDDVALRRETAAALHDRGVVISVASGFSLRAETEVRDFAADMDLFAALGARQVGTVGMDPDIARAHDQLAQLTEMAVQRGMDVVLDYSPHQAINSLEAACTALRHTGSPHALLSIDAMHFFRTGGTVAQLADLDPRLIGYAQLCDVPSVAKHADYAREATFERMIPGEGDLPLTAYVEALPEAVLLGVETPILSEIERGASVSDVLARAVAASRRLLQSSPG